MADGSTDSSELMTDYVGRIALVKKAQDTADEANIRKQFGDGLFHPGGPGKKWLACSRVQKTFKSGVDTVTYADHTSETTNADGLQRIISHRKQEIASTQLANEIIKAALADPNDADPAAKKIQERITAWKAQKTHDARFGYLHVAGRG